MMSQKKPSEQKKPKPRKKKVQKTFDVKFVKKAYKIADNVSNRLFFKYNAVAKSGRISKNDFKQAAFIGVMDAYTRFEPSQGIKFNTFAYSRAKGEVITMLEQKAPVIALSKEVLRLISNEVALNKRIERLYKVVFESKTIAERDSAINLISRLRSAHRGIRPFSGDKLVETGKGKGSKLFDLIEGKAGHSNPLKRAEANDLREYLSKAFVQYLDKRTARVLRLRFLSKQSLPTRAIAEIMEISPSLVSSLLNSGLLKLLNNPKFKLAIGLPKGKTFSKKDAGAIIKRFSLSLRGIHWRQPKK